MFLNKYPGGQGIGRIIGQHLNGGMFQNLAMVVDLVRQMDGRPRFGLTGGKNGLMNVVTVHALSAVFRQRGRVDIYNAVTKGFDHAWRK